MNRYYRFSESIRKSRLVTIDTDTKHGWPVILNISYILESVLTNQSNSGKILNFIQIVVVPISLVFTMFYGISSLKSSTESLEKQIDTEIKVTSLMTLATLMEEFGDLPTMYGSLNLTTSPPQISSRSDTSSQDLLATTPTSDYFRYLISRTNLFLQSSKHPDLNAQLVGFISDQPILTQLFDRKRETIRLTNSNVKLNDSIDLGHVKFNEANLNNLQMHSANLYCTDFSKARAPIDLTEALIFFSNFENANISAINFSDAYVDSSSFLGASISYGHFNVKDSTIAFSDMRGLQRFNKQREDPGKWTDEAAGNLLKAKSLYCTRFDNDLQAALENKAKTTDPPKDLFSVESYARAMAEAGNFDSKNMDDYIARFEERCIQTDVRLDSIIKNTWYSKIQPNKDLSEESSWLLLEECQSA